MIFRHVPFITSCALMLILAVAALCHAGAKEISLLGGAMSTANDQEGSYSWQLKYLEELDDHFSASLSYLNEGHVPVHHRDGHTLQLWGHTNLLNRCLSLAAGIGPYYYYDTVANADGTYTNNHGWKAVATLAATWHTESRWLFQVSSNWVAAGASIDTMSAMAGIGYQLDPPQAAGTVDTEPPDLEKTPANEVTVFLGRTVVNSFSSEHSVATGVEYRRSLCRYLDATLEWLYEGDTRLVRREGLAAQLWGVREFFNDRLALGVGVGAYAALDHYNGNSDFLSTIFTLTGSYRFHPHWATRASWNRIGTNDSRDTDVILGGIGYLF